MEIFNDNLFKMDNEYYIPFNFGFRKNPFTGQVGYFDYIVIFTSSGNNVYSLFDGEIIEINYNQNFRNYVKIKYNDFEIEYGNLMYINVQVGEKIKNGQIIGKVGNSIGSIGVGIYLRIKFKNTPLDPNMLINFDDNRKYY